MWKKLVYSTCLVFGIFISSTLTAYTICILCKQPFANPSLTNQQVWERIVDISKTLMIILSQAVIATAFLWHKILPMSAHNCIRTITTILLFSILIEFFYYIYHRIIHKFFFEQIHKQHHLNQDVYPLDTFDFTLFDSLGLVISIGLPLLILEVTILEQFVVLYIYIISSYLSHSRLLYDHHHKHHYLGHCNYCIFLPIFDILFGTYK